MRAVTCETVHKMLNVYVQCFYFFILHIYPEFFNTNEFKRSVVLFFLACVFKKELSSPVKVSFYQLLVPNVIFGIDYHHRQSSLLQPVVFLTNTTKFCSLPHHSIIEIIIIIIEHYSPAQC